MYKLLKDKNNEFQCEIKLVGASEKTAKVRLFLEGTGCEYSFNGTIDGTRCRVNLGKLKSFSNLMESGKIRLEVIADDTLFIPYESTYELEESKSVTIEMIQPEQTAKKAMVEVRVEESKPIQRSIVKKEVKKLNPINEIKKYLEDNTLFNGTLDSFKIAMRSELHKKTFNRLCEVSKLEKSFVVKEIIK